MRVIVRALNGYKVFSKEYNGVMLKIEQLCKDMGVRSLGELVNCYIDEDLGLTKYVTNKFIIEVWR